MIEHAWTLACTKSIVDAQTNNMSITEVLEQVNVEGPVQFPTIAPMQADVVSVWYRSNPDRGTRGSGRLTFVGPDRNPVGPAHDFAIDLTGYYRARTVTRLAGLPLTGAGIYAFKVEMRADVNGAWREVASVPINVTVQAVAAVPAAAEPARP